VDPLRPPLPIGRSGRLEAASLVAGDDSAVLVRETRPDGATKALLTTDKRPEGELLVITPLDDDVEVRVDGDALAVWIGTGWAIAPPVRAPEPADVPPWASVVGAALLLAIVAFTAIGSAVAFSWLVALFT
jgi:hypothetical protein